MIYRYKFLRERDGRIYSASGNVEWIVGEWKGLEGEPILCEQGYHCSEQAIHALRYVRGEILARVECAGEHQADTDKECWQRMRIVQAWRWTKKDSVALACYAARLVLSHFEQRFPEDRRPRVAIEAAEAWLKDPTDAVGAAASAAASAAYAADGAASAAYAVDGADNYDAAASAAYAAAYAAAAASSSSGASASAGYAAYYAAGSAGAAADGAAESSLYLELSRWLMDHISELEEATDATHPDQTPTA
jgi:hypothetical protein